MNHNNLTYHPNVEMQKPNVNFYVCYVRPYYIGEYLLYHPDLMFKLPYAELESSI